MTPDEGRTWAQQIVRTVQVTVTGGRPCDRQTRSSTVLLQWSADDPAAVAMTVADPWANGATLEWVVGRNLLTAAVLPGLAGELVGRGDVQVLYLAGVVTMTFFPYGARCVIEIAAELVIEFLREAARVVPVGSLEESATYTAAIDREYAELIASQS